jgi:4-amino-4-deoxy-L-arabinose transferase-like glycosyltransferase
MLAVFFALRVKDNRQPRDAAFMGLFFGLSALVNQISLPLVLGLFLVLLVLQFKEWKALLRPMGLAVGTAIVVILPWMIRNYKETDGRLIPVHEGGITQFVKGNYEFELYEEAPLRSVELADLASVELAKSLDRDPNNFDVRSEGLDEDLRSHAVDYVQEHPDKLVSKVALQSLRFWYVSETPRKSYIVGAMQLAFILPALLGVYAGLRAREKRHDTLYLLAIVVYFNLVYAATHVEARYSTPVIPIVVIFAASGVVYAYDRWKIWRARDDGGTEDTGTQAPATT